MTPFDYIGVMVFSMLGVAVIIAWAIELSGRDFEEEQEAEAEALRQKMVSRMTGKNVVYDKYGNIKEIK